MPPRPPSPFVVRGSTVGATAIVLGVAACSSTSTDTGASTSSGGASGSSGSSASSSGSSGKPLGYQQCYEKYFKQILSQCTPSSDCGALTCRKPDDNPTASDRCRGSACLTDSNCASAYASLCDPSEADPFHFTCFKANSLDEAQCNIASGVAPKCTDASGLGPGC